MNAILFFFWHGTAEALINAFYVQPPTLTDDATRQALLGPSGLSLSSKPHSLPLPSHLSLFTLTFTLTLAPTPNPTLASTFTAHSHPQSRPHPHLSPLTSHPSPITLILILPLPLTLTLTLTHTLALALTLTHTLTFTFTLTLAPTPNPTLTPTLTAHPYPHSHPHPHPHPNSGWVRETALAWVGGPAPRQMGARATAPTQDYLDPLLLCLCSLLSLTTPSFESHDGEVYVWLKLVCYLLAARLCYHWRYFWKL